MIHQELVDRLLSFRPSDHGLRALLDDLRSIERKHALALLRNVVRIESSLLIGEALAVLCRFDIAEAYHDVTAALVDSDSDIRWVACNLALNASRDQWPGFESELVALLRTETDGGVRVAAVDALTVHGTPACLPLLQDIVHDDTSVNYEDDPIAKFAKYAINAIVERS